MKSNIFNPQAVGIVNHEMSFGAIANIFQVVDILKLGYKIFTSKLLKEKWTHKFHPTAWWLKHKFLALKKFCSRRLIFTNSFLVNKN